MPTYLSPGVYVEEVESGSRPIEGVGTAVAAFVGLAEQGPLNAPTLVSNWTQFTGTFGDFVPGGYLAHAVYGYFMNGGGNCYVIRIGGSVAEENGHGAAKQLPPATRGHARQPLSDRPHSTPAPLRAPSRSTSPTRAARRRPMTCSSCVVKQGGQVVEEFDRATVTRGKQNVATMVNATSKVLRIDETGSGTIEKPTAGNVALVAPAPPAATPSPSLAAEDYVGDVADRTGFGGLEAVDDVTMVCVPDLMSAYQQGAIDARDPSRPFSWAMIAHCELMGDRIAILDPPPGLNAQQIKEWRVDKAGYDSKYAALYWPWIKVLDPATGQMRLRATIRPHGRCLGPQRRHPRRPQGPRQRGDPRRDHAWRPRSPRPSTTCSIRSASTASAPSPAAASASGVPAPSPPTRPGATSTCGGCSTTSRSPSCSAPSGSSSNRTTTRCGPGFGAPSAPSWSTSGARGPCSALTPDEAFYVKCDARDQPRRGHRRRTGHLRDRSRPGQAGRVRRLPTVPVLRRHQPRQ